MGLMDLLESIKDSVDVRKTVEIRGHKIVIGLLTLEDEQKINAKDSETDGLEGVAYVNAIRKNLLSYSIRSVDGEEIPDYIEHEQEIAQEDGTVDKKVIRMEKALFLKKFLSNFPVQVIDTLFDVYVDIREESEVKINKEIKYEWFKNPEIRAKEREKEYEKLKNKQGSELNTEGVPEGTDNEGEDIKLRKLPDESPED